MRETMTERTPSAVERFSATDEPRWTNQDRVTRTHTVSTVTADRLKGTSEYIQRR